MSEAKKRRPPSMHHQKVRCTQRCVRDERDVRRAVEQNVVVERSGLSQGIDEREDKARRLLLARICDVVFLQRKAAGDDIDVEQVRMAIKWPSTGSIVGLMNASVPGLVSAAGSKLVKLLPCLSKSSTRHLRRCSWQISSAEL